MKKPELQYHENACWTCRFYRVHETGTCVSHCLLLGRDLSTGELFRLSSCDRARYCDAWQMRPGSWDFYTKGNNNPFWVDPYIPRDEQERLRKQFDE